jgi:hypothetical protein
VPWLAVTIALAIAALLVSTPTHAQSPVPSRPGPFVVDIRGAMTGLPQGGGFYPPLPADTLVPSRGFGLGVGAHIYVGTLGVARLAVGLDLLRARGKAVTPGAASTTSTPSSGGTTTPATITSPLSAASRIDVEQTLTAVAPQVSFNFGTREGWSYLSAGYGSARLRSAASGERTGPVGGRATFVEDGGRVAAINYGGGARWFTRGRMAVGFDLRFHRIASTGARPATRLVVLSAGVSLR